jgi:hypothetical protein
MTIPFAALSVPSDARRWLVPALAGALRQLDYLAAAAPPAVLALAVVLLTGDHRRTLEELRGGTADRPVDLAAVRLLAGQAAASVAPAPESALAWDPPAVRALEALAVDLAALPDEASSIDRLAASVLLVLIEPLTCTASPLAELFDYALGEAGPRPAVADALALAAVGRAAHLWMDQPTTFSSELDW